MRSNWEHCRFLWLLVLMIAQTRCFWTPRLLSSRRVALFSTFDDLINQVLNDETLLGRQERRINATADPAGWRVMDWKALGQDDSLRVDLPPSPVDVMMVRDRVVYLKRDDLLRLPGSQISGNKARKMMALEYLEDFPSCLASYGGPQSNAMLALAAVTHFQNQQAPGANKRFVYYTKKLPRFLRNQPSGNLFRAQSLGAQLVELDPAEYNRLFGGDWGGAVEAPPTLAAPETGAVWVPQGGACGMAVPGTKRLAREILDYWTRHGDGRPLSVCLPGGTCSTATMLQHAMKEAQGKEKNELDIEVVVVPCVGDEGYARRQMMALNVQMGWAPLDIPTVLPPGPSAPSYIGKPSNTQSYFQFGEPDPQILQVFREMKDEHQVMLDLLYGASAWAVMLRHWRVGTKAVGSSSSLSPLADREVMYVHSGGLEGINSQLLRYKYKGLVDADEIQLPGRTKEPS